MNLRTISMLSVLLCAQLSFADGYGTPQALLDEKIRLEAAPCNLDCYLTIAGMYSGSYLEGLRSSVMPGLRDEQYGEENTMLLFGGGIPAAELETMSAEEFFARQLLFRGSKVPPEYRFSQLTIVSEKPISDAEVRLLVRYSGLAARPEVEQEGYVTLVKEGEGWKIRP